MGHNDELAMKRTVMHFSIPAYLAITFERQVPRGMKSEVITGLIADYLHMPAPKPKRRPFKQGATL